jgi:hypothetical protein
MKTPIPRTLLAVALFGTLGVAGLAAAQHRGGDGHGPKMMDGHGPRMMQRMDTDGDGVVTQAEAAAYHAARVAEMDANGDGYVSYEEMSAFRAAQREQRARERFQRMDADGDGRVSVQEMAAAHERHFARMDRNADGKLDREDRKGRRQGMRGGHGDH